MQEEARQLLIGMTWLPILSLAAAALVAYRFLRREGAPLTGSWPLDLALAAIALLLTSRAYDEFTMSSAAPYYAAPAVLLLGLLHQRIAERWPTARAASMGALAAVAAGIALYSAVALYPDKGTVVQTAMGSYVAADDSAAVEQEAIDFVRSHTASDEPILALPADAGIYFLADRPAGAVREHVPARPARHPRRRAGGDRRDCGAEHVRYALVSTRDTSAFETGRFGSGYDRLLGTYLRSGRLVETHRRPKRRSGRRQPFAGVPHLRPAVSATGVVGVHPGAELERRSELFAALSEAFPATRFVPVARRAGRGSTLWSSSATAPRPQARPRLGSAALALLGPEAQAGIAGRGRAGRLPEASIAACGVALSPTAISARRRRCRWRAKSSPSTKDASLWTRHGLLDVAAVGPDELGAG